MRTEVSAIWPMAEGAALYLWSSWGGEDARASAAELGIGDCFVAFLPKPDVYLDDQPVHEWRYCQHVLSANAGDAGPSRKTCASSTSVS